MDPTQNDCLFQYRFINPRDSNIFVQAEKCTCSQAQSLTNGIIEFHEKETLTRAFCFQVTPSDCARRCMQAFQREGYRVNVMPPIERRSTNPGFRRWVETNGYRSGLLNAIIEKEESS